MQWLKEWIQKSKRLVYITTNFKLVLRNIPRQRHFSEMKSTSIHNPHAPHHLGRWNSTWTWFYWFNVPSLYFRYCCCCVLRSCKLFIMEFQFQCTNINIITSSIHFCLEVLGRVWIILLLHCLSIVYCAKALFVCVGFIIHTILIWMFACWWF